MISSSLTNVPKIFKKSKYQYFIQISGDLYSDLRNIPLDVKTNIINKEIEIFNEADLILAASRKIYSKITAIIEDKRKLLYFPHGVQYEHFQVGEINPNIEYLRSKKKKIACYFGSLTHAVDQDILIELAENGFFLLLIGPVLADFSKLQQNVNVLFTGPISYDLLPSYAAVADLFIMAWKQGEWINNCNPSKTYEYLALGKPVVSISIPELVESLQDYIYFADNPKDFLTKSIQAIKEDSNELINKRKNKAKENDWLQKLHFFFTGITSK